VGNLKRGRTDGRLITGQNPASAFLAAEKVVEILGKA
jgi:putative intracellular protease/amidase